MAEITGLGKLRVLKWAQLSQKAGANSLTVEGVFPVTILALMTLTALFRIKKIVMLL